jgi:predicted extracellular nuclease
MGDLNDEAENKSVSEILNAKHEISKLKENDLYNFMFKISENWKLGSHKFQGKWGTIDQIIVSSALLKNQKDKLSVQENGAKIFSARFLLEEDKRFMGLQPFRTYAGPKYTGGFSDHLPVYIDLFYSEK